MIKRLGITYGEIMRKAVRYIEDSFLKELLTNQSITDISYNGQKLYYFSNNEGRQYSGDLENNQVMIFLRNIANFTNQKFSYIDTFLDVSVGKYRLSAMHHARGRYDYQDAVSFALRINTNILATSSFMPEHIKNILQLQVNKKQSIVISGPTGVGKTTMQRYLMMLLPANTRIVVIDNVQELSDIMSLNPTLDVTLWQTSENDEDEIAEYVKKALRFHPDYILIAESRGSEMKEIFQSALTGHPNIITIHAESSELAYTRISKLLNSQDELEIMKVFPILVHLDKKQNDDQSIKRFISSIETFNPKKKKMELIYEQDNL